MVNPTAELLRTNRVDPICGMPIDTTNAVAEETYIGVRYLFCSEECHRLFVRAAPPDTSPNWRMVAIASGIDAQINGWRAAQARLNCNANASAQTNSACVAVSSWAFVGFGFADNRGLVATGCYQWHRNSSIANIEPSRHRSG